MIIIDASVLAHALTDDGTIGEACRLELGRDAHWAAPEHLLVETFSAVRGRHRGGRITDRRAEDALEALAAAAIEFVRTNPLLPRMWQLRDNVSGYGAPYVAAAELYGCPLVTADGRLARAGVLRCDVRLAAPAT